MRERSFSHFFADERRAFQFRFAIYAGLLLACLLGGGGSRADILSLLYLRPAAILCLAAMLLIPAPIDFRAIRVPFWLLISLTAWLALQLVPLPPDVWTALPGREPLVSGAATVGLDQPWRPLSLAPDLTLNSLAALVVPFAALLGFAALDQQGRRTLLPFLIGAALVSSLVGIAQISGGSTSPFYLYRVTNEDAAVGLFANRNHQAVLLALTFPLLGVWATEAEGGSKARARRAVAAIVIGAFLVPMILVTGSRAGLILAAVGAVCACFQYAREIHAGTGRRLGWRAPALAGAAAVAIGGLFAFLASGRAIALQRLLGTEENELRLSHLPVFVQMARDMFPWGSGFGTFDPVYRIYEPYETLSPRYLNQAHNDLLDIAITGGLPALLIALVFLGWWAGRTYALLKGWNRRSDRAALGRLGALVILLLLAASLVDYPLRVPLLQVVFAVACGWVGSSRRAAPED